MRKIDKKMLKISARMSKNFWLKLSNECNEFPDIEDAYQAKRVIIHLAISRIIQHYLVSFPKSERVLFIEDFVMELRDLEVSLRDIQ